MTAKDTVLSHAVERQDVPFVVAMVAKAAGPTYTGCFGEAAPAMKAVGLPSSHLLDDQGRWVYGSDAARQSR